MLTLCPMTFAKCLLVALAMWMPAASFAAAVGLDSRYERSAPCEESAPEESSESRAELTEMFLPSSVAPVASTTVHTVHHESHIPLDGHIAELHSPPPNPAVLR